ncbi:MAG: tellurite resistance TerB family protein [Myxococcales bacterium]
MGLLSKLTKATTPQKKPADDALLLHGMMCMAGADGTIEDAEIATVEGYFMQLPEFEGKDFQETLFNAKKILAKYPSMPESVKSLADLSSPLLKKKMFVLAADIAMASGDVDEAEDEILESMQRVLNVDDETANKVLEVLNMKYAKV